MTITLNGTTGVTTPGVTDTGALSVTGISTLGAMGSSVITSGTAQNSTSGTSIDFTSIPSWVKRITVLFNEVSLSGTSAYLIRVGNSGGVSATGYISTSNHFNASNGTAGSNNTTGFLLWENLAANTMSGRAILENLNSNLWVYTATFKNNTTLVGVGAGTTNIATLDRVRITTVNGTDTFDNGSINILYE
jgi:hypothetical protein